MTKTIQDAARIIVTGGTFDKRYDAIKGELTFKETHLPAILDIPVTSQSTFVLLMSSLSMVLALAAVENKDHPPPKGASFGDRLLANSKLWLAATALLGIAFLCYQAYEFTSFVHEGLTIRTNLFGSSFFTLTGFHGAHVSAGVLWLTTLLAIDIKRGTHDEYNDEIQRAMQHTVWLANCNNYYRHPNGKVVTQFPYSGTKFVAMLTHVELDAFDQMEATPCQESTTLR
jgi:hypothetical protein